MYNIIKNSILEIYILCKHYYRESKAKIEYQTGSIF